MKESDNPLLSEKSPSCTRNPEPLIQWPREVASRIRFGFWVVYHTILVIIQASILLPELLCPIAGIPSPKTRNPESLKRRPQLAELGLGFRA